MREPPPTGPIDSEDEEDRLVPRFALHRCLDQGDHRISQRFLRAVGTVVNPAWEMAVGGGLSRLEVPGHRPLMLRITNAYLERLCASPSTTISRRGRCRGAHHYRLPRA